MTSPLDFSIPSHSQELLSIHFHVLRLMLFLDSFSMRMCNSQVLHSLKVCKSYYHPFWYLHSDQTKATHVFKAIKDLSIIVEENNLPRLP